jgi:hypothetical protein
MRVPASTIRLDLLSESLLSLKTTSFDVFLICLWPLAFVAVWAIWKSCRDSADEKLMLRSLDWPEAKGTVLNSEVVWRHVSVTYEYFVGDERYQGEYKSGLLRLCLTDTAWVRLLSGERLTTR